MKNNDVNFDYYQITLFGYEDEPEVVISSSKEEARAEAKEKYGDKMVKSVVRVSGYDLASEPHDEVRKQFYANLQALSGDSSFKLSEDVNEERNMKTLVGRYITKRKAYKAAHNELKTKGGNVHDVARKYHGVDTKELQAMHKEDANPIQEGEDKLLYLARLGLMDKNEVLLLKRAIGQKRSGAPMSVKNRDLLFKLMEKLIAMITGHRHMWNLARRRVMEEIINEFDDYVVSEEWVRLDNWLMEAGYCDAPQTKAEVKKRYPNIETDVKNKNSRDLQPVRFK